MAAASENNKLMFFSVLRARTMLSHQPSFNFKGDPVIFKGEFRGIMFGLEEIRIENIRQV